MHFHHRHDVDGCVDAHEEWTEVEKVFLATLDRLESYMSAQQTSIDTAVAVIGDLVAEVQNLKAQISPAVDTSALDAAVLAAQAVVNPAVPDVPVADAPVAVDPVAVDPGPDVPAPAPVDPAPADFPSVPVPADPAAPVDITVPAS